MMILRDLILIMCLGVSPIEGMVEGLYCGLENCYDVLGVTRDTPKQEMARAYRQLAKQHHPDRHQSEEDKATATIKFKIIATAYEILKDDEARIDYDYMLDHPEEHYRHYYHYYRRRMSPKVDVRIVVAVTISVISVFQYYTARFRWDSGVRYLATQPKYRKMALEYAENEGMLDEVRRTKKRNKDFIKTEEEKIIKQVLEENMDIRGGYRKPNVTDVLWVQLIFLPYTIALYCIWYFRWVWRFDIKREEYGIQEQLYLIRRYLGLSETQFESVSEYDQQEFLREELWKKEKFKVWKAEKDEEKKRQMAESARYKSYRRYMKKHGTGRMYFDDS